jgi:transposase
MTEPKRNEDISRWRAGSSIRKIARELGVSRNTVSGVLARIEAERTGHAGSPLRRRSSNLDPFEPFIQELLGRYPDLTAVRLLEALRGRGFTGGYTVVRQRLSALRPCSSPLPVVRFETAQGAQAQIDYSTYDLDFSDEGRRRVYAFSYVLGYSRRQYLRFVENQEMMTIQREHLRAFEHLGGVAATCLYDDMKVVMTGREDDAPIYNSRFLAFATHYCFRPVACRPRRPQTKGKVERPFHYVETSLFNSRTFASLDHLNEVCHTHVLANGVCNFLPSSVVTPLGKVVVNGALGRQVLGQHTPLAARTVEVEDGVEHLSHVVDAGSPDRVHANQRLKQPPLIVGKVRRLGLTHCGMLHRRYVRRTSCDHMSLRHN